MLLLTAAGAANAAEGWPRWLGPEGNNISTETGLAAQWPEDGPKKVWAAKVGIGFSSPVALDGKIYMFAQEGSSDVLHVFDAESGKVVWTQKYDRGEDPAFPGTRATPTIEGNRIYTHGSAGDLVCRELADGKLVWRTNILKETSAQKIEWGSASSPLVTDKHIFVQGGQGGDATAVAVDKTSGAIVWKSEARGMAGYATPILIEVDPQSKQQQLIVFGGDAVYGMDPATGKTRWTEPWKTDNDINAATPVYSRSHLLVSSSRNFGAMLINVTPQGAKKEWEKKDVALKFQPPILDGTTLYANSGGTLKAVNWPDFKVLWTATGRDLNLGAGGSLVKVGDKLITLSERGKLSLVQASPTGYKLISQAQVFDYSQVWSSPLVYRGKVYVKGEDELVCFDISGPKP
jgi:outer membrane protein assembly factor BamB